LVGIPVEGPRAHDVTDDERRLRGRDEAERLRHQIDSGAGGSGHRSRPGARAAERHVDGREFVLGLNDDPAVVLDPSLQILHHVRRGRDGVAGVEPTAGGQRAHPDRLVAVQQNVVVVRGFEFVRRHEVVLVLDVFRAGPGRLLVVLDDRFAFAPEPFFERLVEILDVEPRDRAGRTQRDDVPHDRAAGVLRESFQRHVEPRHLAGGLELGHHRPLAVVDDDRILVEFVEVLVDGPFRERDQYVESVNDALDVVDRRPYLVGGVAAPDSRREILRGKDVSPRAGERLGEDLPGRVDPVAGFPADGPV